MSQVPAGFVLLDSSVYRSLSGCLRDLRMPRFSAIFCMLDQTVGLHDGHTVTGIGPEYAELFGCLKSAMGEKLDGLIVLDRREQKAWWAPTGDATEFLAQHNPPTPTYLSDGNSVVRGVH